MAGARQLILQRGHVLTSFLRLTQESHRRVLSSEAGAQSLPRQLSKNRKNLTWNVPDSELKSPSLGSTSRLPSPSPATYKIRTFSRLARGQQETLLGSAVSFSLKTYRPGVNSVCVTECVYVAQVGVCVRVHTHIWQKKKWKITTREETDTMKHRGTILCVHLLVPATLSHWISVLFTHVCAGSDVRPWAQEVLIKLPLQLLRKCGQKQISTQAQRRLSMHVKLWF